MKNLLLIFGLLFFISCLDSEENIPQNPQFQLDPVLEGKWNLVHVSLPFISSNEFDKGENIWYFDTVNRKITIENSVDPLPHGYSSLAFQTDTHNYTIDGEVISIKINRFNQLYERNSKYIVINNDSLGINPPNGFTDSEYMLLVRD